MGKGDVPLTTVMLAHRALGQLILLTPAESRARTELPRSTRIMTNTQNWKNFRNGVLTKARSPPLGENT